MIDKLVEALLEEVARPARPGAAAAAGTTSGPPPPPPPLLVLDCMLSVAEARMSAAAAALAWELFRLGQRACAGPADRAYLRSIARRCARVAAPESARAGPGAAGAAGGGIEERDLGGRLVLRELAVRMEKALSG